MRAPQYGANVGQMEITANGADVKKRSAAAGNEGDQEP